MTILFVMFLVLPKMSYLAYFFSAFLQKQWPWVVLDQWCTAGALSGPCTQKDALIGLTLCYHHFEIPINFFLGMVVHICNPSTWEAKAGEF
jgi:hypothetical protein